MSLRIMVMMAMMNFCKVANAKRPILLRKDGKSLYDNCAKAKDTANVDRWHSRNTNTYACPSHSPLSSFLIPVTTKTGALYFADKIQVTDKQVS